jgi:hypothetical protein
MSGIEWAAHGLQPADAPRRIPPPPPPPPPAATTYASATAGPIDEKPGAADMSTALSKFFTVLDPMRDLLAAVLDGWQGGPRTHCAG